MKNIRVRKVIIRKTFSGHYKFLNRCYLFTGDPDFYKQDNYWIADYDPEQDIIFTWNING